MPLPTRGRDDEGVVVVLVPSLVFGMHAVGVVMALSWAFLANTMMLVSLAAALTAHR